MRDDYCSHKGDPFAMFLYERSLGGSWTDEETGDVGGSGWFGRIGRRIISEDSQGFVDYERYPTVRDAETVFAEIVDDGERWCESCGESYNIEEIGENGGLCVHCKP